MGPAASEFGFRLIRIVTGVDTPLPRFFGVGGRWSRPPARLCRVWFWYGTGAELPGCPCGGSVARRDAGAQPDWAGCPCCCRNVLCWGPGCLLTWPGLATMQPSRKTAATTLRRSVAENALLRIPSVVHVFSP